MRLSVRDKEPRSQSADEESHPVKARDSVSGCMLGLAEFFPVPCFWMLLLNALLEDCPTLGSLDAYHTRTPVCDHTGHVGAKTD